jgi:drug/metabolite transporter (DMT)-like permease
VIGFFSGAKILKGEVIGLFTAIAGCAMIMLDPNAQKVDSKFT